MQVALSRTGMSNTQPTATRTKNTVHVCSSHDKTHVNVIGE